MMTKQIQKSSDKSKNLQIGRDQITAYAGAAINIEGQSAPESLMKEIYTDLGKPGVKQVGAAIGNVLGLVNTLSSPLKYLNESSSLIYKSNFDRLRERLAAEEDENIVEVPPEVAKPLLEKLFYVSNDDLAELFINLLSRASRKDEAYLAHPNFVNIISSLSPDEARIINYIAPRNYIRCISQRWEKNEDNGERISTLTYRYTKRGLAGLEKEIEILFPENYYMYFKNMLSLGLIDFYEDATLDEDISLSEGYDEIIAFYEAEIHEGKFDKHGYESKIMLGRVDLSELGEMFVKACTNIEELNADFNFTDEDASIKAEKTSEDDDMTGVNRIIPNDKGNVVFGKPEW